MNQKASSRYANRLWNHLSSQPFLIAPVVSRRAARRTASSTAAGAGDAAEGAA